MLLQGTRPRFASDTLMSRRNIPTSPLLTLSPSRGRWSSGCGCAAGNEPRALGLGRVCAEAGRGGILGLGTADSSPRLNIGFRVPNRKLARARLSYTFLKRHQGARALRGRVPLQERRKCIASQAHTSKASHRTRQAPLHKRGTHPARHLKTLEGCSTHHTVVLT